MRTVDSLLSKVVRALWLAVGYFGLIEVINAAKVGFGDNGFIGAVVLFVLGVLNLVNAFGLFKKRRWSFRATFWVATFNLFFFSLYLLLPIMLLNLIIAYMAIRFKENFGAKKEDRLLNKKWLFKR